MTETDEWPPKRARTREDWSTYWERQRWDRRFRHDVLQPHWARLVRKLKAPRGWYRQARWFIQRGRRGWAPPDLWSMGDYICDLLGQMTAEMTRIAHGHPCQGLTVCGGMPDAPPCSCEQDWDDTLDKISGPLLAYRLRWDWPDSQSRDEHWDNEKKAVAEAQGALRLLADHLPSMWD
jgi:hypothetical protein